jgi:hypothetical protein
MRVGEIALPRKLSRNGTSVPILGGNIKRFLEECYGELNGP